MNKRRFHFLHIVLSVILLLSLTAPAVPVMAVTQSEIDELEAQRDELQSRQSDVQEQIASLQNDVDSILARKAALDEQSELLRQDIVILNEQIEIYDQIIVEKQADAERARAEEEEQFNRYRLRVRAMEESSTWTYISVLLKATSLTDFLSRLNDVTDILRHDRNMKAEYEAAREYAEAVVAEYEEAQAARRDKQAELLAQEQELAEKIQASGWLLVQLEDDMEAYLEFYEAVEAQKEEVQALIDQKAEELRKQQEEAERARRAAEAAAAAQQAQQTQQAQNTAPPPNSGANTAGAGYYAWPTYTTYITSRFGPRTHPIYGELKPHTGVDIGASYGTSITAAAAGTVSLAVVDYGTAGYGTYVAIYHSNGTTTLYAHMSSLAVSVGDTVTQGQVIGYVGSTGAATGPHLHFEIRENGACVDPIPYFSNLSFTYG